MKQPSWQNFLAKTEMNLGSWLKSVEVARWELKTNLYLKKMTQSRQWTAAQRDPRKGMCAHHPTVRW